MSTMTQNPWKTTIPQPGGTGGDFTPCPPGNHFGRICGLFDVGHHPVDRTDDKGTTKTVDTRQLVIVFELSKKDPNGQPYTMAVRYTFSMNEKATLYSFVKNVTGQAPRPGQEFDPTGLLGKPVMVTVIAKASRDGSKTYSNVGTVGAWPEGMPEPPWTITPVAWSVQESSPFPEAGWHPYVFGKAIKTLAEESKERRGYSTPVSSAGSVSRINQAIVAIRQALDEYPPAVQALMSKYTLLPGYTVSELDEKRDVVGMPEASYELLQGEAVPF